MPVLIVIVRMIIGAVVGFLIGTVLNKWFEYRDEKQLKRVKDRTDAAIDAAFDPIRKLDQRKW